METKKIHRNLTTIPGLFLSGGSLLIWLLSYFVELKREVDDWYLLIAFCLGVLLMLAPQKFTELIFNRAKNFK